MANTPKKTRNERRYSKSMIAAATGGEKIREQIVQLRNARGLTSADVAKQMGISRPFYTQLEGGTRRMDLVYFWRYVARFAWSRPIYFSSSPGVSRCPYLDHLPESERDQWAM